MGCCCFICRRRRRFKKGNIMHVIKKVPLEELLDVLNDLYEKGVDYVDLITKEDENRISLIFTEEYMAPEAREEFEEGTTDEIIIDTKLSDEDLNQLI
jgi:hypothetical protein